MSGRESWGVGRMNAEGNRRTALAQALHNAWHSGDKNWKDLADVALHTLKPGRVDADAVFTIELQPDRTQVRTQAPWGGDPEALLKRGITALQNELDTLHKCPVHRATSTPETVSESSSEGVAS